MPIWLNLFRLNKADARVKRNSEADITPQRKAEIDKLDKEYADASTLGSIVPALKKGFDTVTHPEEWTMQSIASEALNPINYASIGAGKVLGTAANLGSKLIRGAVAGGVEATAQNAAIEYSKAKGRGQSDEEAQKAAIGGGATGLAMGAPLGAVGGAMAKTKVDMPNDDVPTTKASDGIDANDGFDEAMRNEYSATPQKSVDELLQKRADSLGMTKDSYLQNIRMRLKRRMVSL